MNEQHIRNTIAALEGELEATQQRCGQIEKTIRNIREIWNLPEEDADLEVEEPIAARKPPKAERTNKAKRAPRAGADKSDDAGEHGDRIVLAVKKDGGISRPGALAKALGFANTTTLAYHCKKLVRAKRLVFHGNGAGRVIGLPGVKPKEGP